MASGLLLSSKDLTWQLPKTNAMCTKVPEGERQSKGKVVTLVRGCHELSVPQSTVLGGFPAGKRYRVCKGLRTEPMDLVRDQVCR